ncbi:MAG: glycosyltransferase [Bacteroidales bacterium]|jgi:GT2 family glycosyltransferase|nr:glycosyltransferase [Bacteroidales bacterium]
MKLSVIIVNYNVKYILEQCLYSVQIALRHIDGEVFVVDNNSVDGSCRMIQEKFPDVILIANKENLGFAKANNQAIRQSQGEYVVLLNPDTVVEEDTFEKVLTFMDETHDSGGVGVKMIDGKGKYLPESKRGLPTLKVSFYKMFGFHKLFPHSKRFNYYYLGHLNEESTHEIDILSGACMFLRTSVLDKIGLLDEEYFMYGEDIDLSYRISQAGHKNYYFPHTTIIHYKGESTKKASFKYVMVFYKAMEIFARKQLHMKKYSLYWFIIHTAIWIRALFALVSRVVKKIIFPILDVGIIMSGFYILATWWASYHFGNEYYYPREFFNHIAPVFTGLYLIAIYFSAGYERPVKLNNLIKGISFGFLSVLIIYSLFPESLRYSRLLLLLGFAWNMITLITLRGIFHVLGISNLGILIKENKHIVLVGNEKETKRVYTFLHETGHHNTIVGFISLDRSIQSEKYIGTIDQLQEIVRMYNINEIIFCLQDVGAAQIIKNMLRFTDLQVDFKIAPPESFSVIGSNSSNTAGELYIIEFNSIAKGLNKKKKRLFDISCSFLLLCTSFIWTWFMSKPWNALKNCVQVLFGTKTWIGYSPIFLENQQDNQLPKIKKSVLYPGMNYSWKNHTSVIEQAHISYIKDYKIRQDIYLVYKHFQHLSNS